MNAANPINQLTEEQAVGELAAIMDSAPDEEDQLARIHWSQENAQRAQQLEAHILHLHKLAGGELTIRVTEGILPPDAVICAGTPVPVPEPGPVGPIGVHEVAPPHQLQPKPALAAAKEKPMPSRKRTPKERLQTALDCYLLWLEKVRKFPNNRPIRRQTAKYATHVRAMATRFKLACPDLPALPDLPDPKQKGPRGPQKVKKESPQCPLRPDPFIPAPSACAEDCVHPDHHHASTADLDQRDRFPGFDPKGDSETLRVTWSEISEPPRARKAQDIARNITGNFWPLCQAIEELPDREVMRPVVDIIHARLQMAYALLDEVVVGEGE